MAGMSAQVDVVLYDNPQALTLPVGAVQEANGQRYVLRRNAQGTPVQVPVQTGKTTQHDVEIIQGLQAGDEVLLGAHP
jgi:multidrug efflux pump subunit AcrA (membrane-fusion protein)